MTGPAVTETRAQTPAAEAEAACWMLFWGGFAGGFTCFSRSMMFFGWAGTLAEI